MTFPFLVSHLDASTMTLGGKGGLRIFPACFPSLCIHFYLALITSKWPQVHVMKCPVLHGKGVCRSMENSDRQCMFSIECRILAFLIPVPAESTVLSPWNAEPSASPFILQSGGISFAPLLALASPFQHPVGTVHGNLTGMRPLHWPHKCFSIGIYFLMSSNL